MGSIIIKKLKVFYQYRTKHCELIGFSAPANASNMNMIDKDMLKKAMAQQQQSWQSGEGSENAHVCFPQGFHFTKI